MRNVVDPAFIELGGASWFFLAVVGVVLPALAYRQHRLMGDGPVAVSRVVVYVSAALSHLVLLTLSALVLREQPVDFFPPYRLGAFGVVVGLVALALGMIPLARRWVPEDPVALERTRLIAPRTPKEHAAFLYLSVSAGFVEEIAYRGVLFALLAAMTGGWLVPALLASAAFGVVHLFQGRRSATIAGLMGLREHVVVGLTGTLFISMAVHILHNLIMGIVVGARARRAARAGEEPVVVP